MEPQRKKAVTEAMRNREMETADRPELSAYRKQHYSVMLKTDQKKQ